jgi:hypothetical protein
MRMEKKGQGPEILWGNTGFQISNLGTAVIPLPQKKLSQGQNRAEGETLATFRHKFLFHTFTQVAQGRGLISLS